MKELNDRPLCNCHREPMYKNGRKGWKCAVKTREQGRRYYAANADAERERQRRRNATPRGRAYASWLAARARCTKPYWPWYGGRGITMCDEWLESFEAFYAHLGGRPKGRTLDRINNDRGYEPGNVRYATPRQQTANRRPRRRETS